MSDLPPGWEWATLGEVADIRGGIQKQAKRRPVENKYPFLRVANVLRGQLNLSEIHEVELFEGELDRYRLQRGDLLVVEGNGSPDQIGRAALWDGSINDCVHQNHLICVRPSPAVLPEYLEYAWNSPTVSAYVRSVAGSTSGLYTLSVGKLRSVVLPVPPLAEQRRIVAAVEKELSRLEAGKGYLQRAAARRLPLRRSRLMALREEALLAGAVQLPLGELADTSLGKMLDAKRSTGELSPYLRNINVRWGSVDLTNVERVPLGSRERTRFALQAGDLLVCEGGEPGRCAVWRDSREMAYQKALHRVRVSERVLVDWVALMLEESVRNGRINKEVYSQAIL